VRRRSNRKTPGRRQRLEAEDGRASPIFFRIDFAVGNTSLSTHHDLGLSHLQFFDEYPPFDNFGDFDLRTACFRNNFFCSRVQLKEGLIRPDCRMRCPGTLSADLPKAQQGEGGGGGGGGKGRAEGVVVAEGEAECQKVLRREGGGEGVVSHGWKSVLFSQQTPVDPPEATAYSDRSANCRWDCRLRVQCFRRSGGLSELAIYVKISSEHEMI